MKRYLALAGLTLAITTLASAQEVAVGERVVVPARNTTHPRVVIAHITHGTLTVKAYNGKEVIVETRSSNSSRREERTVDGLRRIDLPERGIVVEEEDNVIHVSANAAHSPNILITVPVDTSLNIKSTNGNVAAEGVHGEVEAGSTNGSVTLTNISGTVVASTTNGSVKVTMDRVDPGKPLAFSSTNGSLDVTLPADLKANLKMRSLHGSVYSDFEMRLTGGQPTTTGGGDTKYRVEFDHTMYGTINGGGTDVSLSTVNGRIMIRKKS
jgi:DUF4097 and DUF4098 domain-containing protein YvlB